MVQDLSKLPPDELQQALNGPALTPPPGVVPSLIQYPPDNGDYIALPVLTVLYSLGAVSALLRLFARWEYLKKGYIVEVLLILALLAFTTYVGGCLVRITYGPGFFVHQWDVPLRNMSIFLWGDFFETNIYIVCIGLTKAAILLEWVRIFVPMGIRNTLFWSTHILLLLNTVFYAAVLITLNLSCFPQQRIWNKVVPGRCVDTKTLELATAAVNVGFDLGTLLLPQRTIWGLQMHRKRRIGVSIVFGVGFLGIISAITRVISTAKYNSSEDGLYEFTAVVLSAHAEMTSALLVLCVPAIPRALADMRANKLVLHLSSSVVRFIKGHPKGIGQAMARPSTKSLTKGGDWEAHEPSSISSVPQIASTPIETIQDLSPIELPWGRASASSGSLIEESHSG